MEAIMKKNLKELIPTEDNMKYLIENPEEMERFLNEKPPWPEADLEWLFQLAFERLKSKLERLAQNDPEAAGQAMFEIVCKVMRPIDRDTNPEAHDDSLSNTEYFEKILREAEIHKHGRLKRTGN